MNGSVVSVNVNPDGGVPKMPVSSAMLGKDGVVGDKQNDPRHHGGPDRAVSLYSLEVIESLAEEGHPVRPGYAGENITISHLDWSLIQPGVLLKIGGSVVEITGAAVPCATIKGCFLNGNFHRISEKRNPGSSRWYGRVLTEAEVVTGDPVVLLK